MKLLLLLAYLVAPLAANASLPVLTCHSPHTGADFSLGYYADHTYFMMNDALVDALERQGVRDLSRTGDGGDVKKQGNEVSYSANLRMGYVSMNREDGGYRLRVVQYQGAASNFWFNHGECKVEGP